jgi:hypothetical protein
MGVDGGGKGAEIRGVDSAVCSSCGEDVLKTGWGLEGLCISSLQKQKGK